MATDIYIYIYIYGCLPGGGFWSLGGGTYTYIYIYRERGAPREEEVAQLKQWWVLLAGSNAMVFFAGSNARIALVVLWDGGIQDSTRCQEPGYPDCTQHPMLEPKMATVDAIPVRRVKSQTNRH